MSHSRRAVGGLLASTLGSAALFAASFELVGDKAAAPPVIRLTAMIENGDAARLRLQLVELRKNKNRAAGAPLATIEMNSPGGDLLEGMKLGYLFREFDVATVVRAGDSCLSSCALAFLGGTSRHIASDVTVSRTVEIGGTLGFHNFWLNPNHESANADSGREGVVKGFNQAKGAASRLIHYGASLGVDPDFIARMLGRPPEVWDYADTAGKFIDLKICPTGLKLPQPPPGLSAVNICSNMLGDEPEGEPPAQARTLPPSEVKRYLLNHIRQNMASLNVRGPLATQLATAATGRDDRPMESAYADLRAAAGASCDSTRTTSSTRTSSARRPIGAERGTE